MYYVFFETGDKEFYLRIINIFCSKIIQYIYDIYKTGVITQTNGVLDQNKFKNYIKNNKQSLFLFNCQLFPALCCKNDRCQVTHKAVLALNQLEYFEQTMYNSIKNIFWNEKNLILRKKGRLNFQNILHSFITASIQELEVINIENKNDHHEYLHLYVTEVNKLNNIKYNADGFIYVRSHINSDYDYFKANTSLLNVTACNYFQQLL
ncbi:MAG: hypothetical protein FWD13_06515 [Treponema sp.]|nr:hypothetical protein [Treponema sp.]